MRIKNAGDFVRLEIREALRMKKLLIPLWTSQAPGTPAFDIGEMIIRANLPADVAGMAKLNMVELSTNLFDASISKLDSFIKTQAQQGTLDGKHKLPERLSFAYGEPEPEPAMDEISTCETMNAARRFVSTLGLPDGRLNAQYNVCYCDEGCGSCHPDLASRGQGQPDQNGSGIYGLPKGWCCFGLQVDESEFRSRRVWEDWNVSFHGTKVATAREILQSDWQLLKPGDETPSGYQIPIRPGHVLPDTVPGFDPNQIFTSPSIKYCCYRTPLYCDTVGFEDHSISVAFQLRQQPDTYTVGPETVGATARAETIDPHFPNDELEWYTKRSGVHKLTRLLVRVLPPRTPQEKAREARSDPRWVADHMAAVCMAEGCNTAFSFFEGKHHCRYCGWVVCSSCCGSLEVDRWVSSERPHKFKLARDEQRELKKKTLCRSCLHFAPAEIETRQRLKTGRGALAVVAPVLQDLIAVAEGSVEVAQPDESADS